MSQKGINGRSQVTCYKLLMRIKTWPKIRSKSKTRFFLAHLLAPMTLVCQSYVLVYLTLGLAIGGVVLIGDRIAIGFLE